MRRSWLVLVMALLGLGALPVLAEPVPIRGQVVDADGKPRRGASVALQPVVSRFATWELRLQGKAAPEPVARTASLEDGRFEIAAPSPGMWEIQVTAPGFVTRRFSLPLLEPMELPRVEMVQEVPLRVRAVAPQGRPLAGAQVRVSLGETPAFTPILWWGPQPDLVTTGPDGTATVSRWKGMEVELEAAAPGYPPAALKVAAKESLAEVRLAAGCPRTVQVNVRGKDGAARPVAGALAIHRSWPLGITGEDGRMTVTAPCDRDLRIAIETRDGRQARATLRPGAPADRPVAVTLPAEPVRVSGRVLTEGSRAPVAGALVWSIVDPAAFVRTDAKGEYTLLHTAGETSAVTADAVGYLADTGQAQAGAAGPTFLLKPLATASGVVVDEAGRPVAGARVRATADDPSESGLWNPLLSTRSDARGELRLRVLTGKDITLSVSHPDFVTAELSIPPMAPHASRTGLRIVLTQGLAASGKVVDAEGRPIAGAEVWLFPSMDEREGFAFRRQMEQRLTPVVTDARGTFTLEHLKPGRMDLQAAAHGFAPTRVRGLQLAGGEGPVDLGTVTLGPGVALAGVVVDPRDRPVAGATVRILGSGSPLPWALLRAGEEELLTAADGSFSIPGLPPEERVTLSVTRKGYADADFRDLQVPPAEPLRIVLTPGSRLAGRLVDEAGDPVPGGMVSLYRIGSQSTGGAVVDHAGMTGTGADGDFAVEGVTAGKVRLVAAAPRFLRAEIPVVEVTAGRDVDDLELVLRRGAVLTGRVLSPSGEPVTGARVEPVDQTEDGLFVPSFQGTVSDAEGRYRLEGLPEGAVRSFAAEAEGFPRTVKDAEVRPGENRLDFRLDAGHEVSGRVVDATGAPVAGALVSTARPGTPFIGHEGPWEGTGIRTGADGSFRLAGVPTGVYEVQAGKEGYAPGRLQAVEIAGPLQGLELRLGAAGSIHGGLTGLEAAELAGVEVSAQPLSPDTFPGYAGGQVDYQGQYRVGGLAAGEWRVMAQATSGLRALGKVTVPAGGDALLDLEFARGFTLTGRVLRGGEPVQNAQVVAMATEGDSHGFSSTGPQGTFRIPGLAPGSYQLRVLDSYGLNHQDTVEISGDRDLLVEISGQRVSGRVVDATNQSPIVRARVSLEPEAVPGASKAASSDDQGAFTLTDVYPGVYRLQARVDGYAPASSPVEVGDAGVDGVVLALQPTEGLVLEVRGALGSPPPQIQVAFLDATGRSVLEGSHTTGENGRVRISSAPPGTWQLLVSASGYATIERAVQVPSPTVAIALPRGSILTVEAPGVPEHAVVTITDAGGRPFRSLGWQAENEWHVHGGKAEIAGLPPGRWQVRITAPDGGQAWQAEVSTAAGSPARVVVR